LGAENVSFNLRKGEILSLVGESGSGKTTVGRMILRLIKPTSGKCYLLGRDIYSYQEEDYYRRVQAIFQDPFTSFNPNYPIEKPLKDCVRYLRVTTGDKSGNEEKLISSALKDVGLIPDQVLKRYPHELSGGQLQLVLIARCLIIKPELLVADEVTTMIDASTRVTVLNGLLKLAKEEGMALLFITHDIGQAYYISDRMAIMHKGRIVEMGSCETVLFEPKSPYARELIASVPKLHEKWKF
jgi:peptide/nickel transport system ATP-binding protein